MDEKVNNMVFTPEPYNGDIKEMWQDIGNLLRILVKNGYQVAIRDDDFNIIVLEFESDNPEFGTPMIRWLSEDKYYEYLARIAPEEEEDDYAKY